MFANVQLERQKYSIKTASIIRIIKMKYRRSRIFCAKNVGKVLYMYLIFMADELYGDGTYICVGQ